MRRIAPDARAQYGRVIERLEWKRTLAWIAEAAAFERDDGSRVIAKRNFRDAIDAARAMRSDHDADLSMNAPPGNSRSQPLAAGSSSAVFGIIIQYLHSLRVRQANFIGGCGWCGLCCGRGRRRLRQRGRRPEGSSRDKDKCGREGSKVPQRQMGHAFL